MEQTLRLTLGALVLMLGIACGDDDTTTDGSTGTDSATRADGAASDAPGSDGAATDAPGSDGAATDAPGSDAPGSDGAATDAPASDAPATPDGGDDAAMADAGDDAPARTCANNGECGRATYCAADTCDGPGLCEVRPLICTDIFAPVCGCDDVTYSNACQAASAGARVASEGECAVACTLRPAASCCFEDTHCLGRSVCRSATCVRGGAGTCVAAPVRNQCWVDSDCGPRELCSGANQCPCGAMCFAPDSPGTCVARAM